MVSEDFAPDSSFRVGVVSDDFGRRDSFRFVDSTKRSSSGANTSGLAPTSAEPSTKGSTEQQRNRVEGTKVSGWVVISVSTASPFSVEVVLSLYSGFKYVEVMEI